MLSIAGALIGFATSFLPRIMDFFQDARDKLHEIHLIELQSRLGDSKLEMFYVDAEIRQTEALLRHDSSLNRRASQWVTDLAASVRPIISYLFFLLFFTLTVSVNADWITIQQFNAIWSRELEAIFAAVISFWFGSRTLNRHRT